jgi:methyl-accepting chemotaxis protein
VSAAPDELATARAGMVAAGIRRRWWTTLGGAAALTALDAAGLVVAPAGAVLGAAAAALTLNAVLAAAARSIATGPALLAAGALADLALAAVPLGLTGERGFIVLLPLAVLPFAAAFGPSGATWAAVAGGAASLLAPWIHARWSAGGGAVVTLLDLPPTTYLDAALVVLVGAAVGRGPARFIARLRRLRHAVEEAARGDLAIRAPAADDELGAVERALNQMLASTGEVIARVQREADEVAAYGQALAAATDELQRASTAMNGGAARLTASLEEQRGIALASGDRARTVTASAATTGERAGSIAAQARALVEAAEQSRERIGRAGTTLLSVGEQVRSSVAAVSALAPLSERIGGLARAISRIARQTNLLALNAAIEAARAGEHGRGFAVVALEVRKLAEEAARAAKDVGGTIEELRAGVSAAVETIGAGEAKVRDVGAVAAEADQALREVLAGIAEVSAVVDRTGTVQHDQTAATRSLLAAMDQVAALAAAAAEGAAQTAGAVTQQQAAMERLAATAQQLADVAERLRGAVVRFTVLGRRHDTAEYVAVRG